MEFAGETVAGNCECFGRTGRPRRACGGRGEPRDRHSRIAYENRDGAHRADSDADFASRLAAFLKQWRSLDHADAEKNAALKRAPHFAINLPLTYSYFTEQPYGRELGVVTGWPAIASSSAAFT